MAALVGHGNVRVAAMGWDDREATAAEMERMRQLTARAMEDGAVGLSSGLAYAPGPYAPLDELVALGEVIAPFGGIYTSHIRNQTKGIAEAVAEVTAVAERAPGWPATCRTCSRGPPCSGPPPACWPTWTPCGSAASTSAATPSPTRSAPRP